MKVKSSVFVMIFALALVVWAQSAPVQAPPSGAGRGELRAEHRQEMMEKHQQEMEAMKADVGRLSPSRR